MGDNLRRFQNHPLNVLGAVVFTKMYYIYMSKYFKKGHNSVRKRTIEKSSIHAQLHTMVDNPRRFQDHPLKTVGGAVFTRIC